jgi:hypothetical protein
MPWFNGTVLAPDSVITSLSFNAPILKYLSFLATNGSAWATPRAAFTELFGLTANRGTWATVSGMISTNQQAMFCVSLSNIGNGAQVHLEYSTDQSVWTTLTAVSLAAVSIGLNCSSNAAIPNGTFAASTTYYFRVTAKQGGLSTATLTFETANVQFTNYVTLSVTNNIAVACTPTYDTATATSVNIDVDCGDGTNTLGTTMVVNWLSGIPA